MIPESWQPVIAEWSVYIVAALAITTGLVHVLRPIARAVQRWTLTTAVTWDDGPARWLADRLDWLAGVLDTVLGLVPHVTVAPKPAAKPKPKAPPSDGALALALCLIAAAGSVLTSGCGNPYADQARAATVAAGTLSAGGEMIDAARDSALDRVEAAHPEHGAERTAALEAEAARWRPAGVALDDAREALLTWVQAIDTARVADAGGDLLPQLLAIARRVIALYDAAVSTAEAAGATDVPALPAVVRALIGGE